ncbi:hypothetical protein TUM17580_31340 [Citrobacter farmeri]|uniref:hypothetical protein n=1 Tax=Citrobacter farmeri TaxID=67824 RepID=UPI001E553F55|nr:hypothetical protein [Citrobacter farmeri]GJL47075.1 hypothetical protein TUM17580_31340 [Citrobacter farmeri]
MAAKIREINGSGVLEDECVVIDIRKDVVNRILMLGDNRFISGSHDHGVDGLTHFFPAERFQAGDVIRLHTKKGLPERKAMANGNFLYDFFLGLDSAHWSYLNSGGVVFDFPCSEMINR